MTCAAREAAWEALSEDEQAATGWAHRLGCVGALSADPPGCGAPAGEECRIALPPGSAHPAADVCADLRDLRARVALAEAEIREWRERTGHYRPGDWRETWLGRCHAIAKPGEDFDSVLARTIRERDEARALVADLRSVATYEIRHVGNGRCPDDADHGESNATRDEGCPACAVLLRADAVVGDAS